MPEENGTPERSQAETAARDAAFDSLREIVEDTNASDRDRIDAAREILDKSERADKDKSE